MQKYFRGQKMKKFLKSVALVMLTCVCIFAGCKAKGLNDNPSADALTYGNGHNAIIKGDYLYYVNGYVDSYTDVYTVKDQNEWGKVTLGAIYRTKLVNGSVQKDENGFLVKTEVVVPRLVGFENGKFMILGDYIYYSTPRMREDASGKVRNDYIEYNRVKIDGTKNEQFYVASSQIPTANWNIYNYNNETYMLIIENSNDVNTIKSVNIRTKKVITLGENATSWALSKENVLTKVEGYEYNKYIYFTRAIVSDDKISDTGNLVVKVDITNGSKELYTIKQNTTKTIVGYANNMLYYSLAVSGDNTDLYVTDVTLNKFNENNMSRITNGGYDKYYILDKSTLTVIAIDSSQNVYLCVNGNTQSLLLNDGKEITIVGIVGDNMIYIDSDKNLMMKNYKTNSTAVSLKSEDKTYLINSIKIDETKGNLYLFAQYTGTDKTTNYYLNYINLSKLGEGSFVGKFADGHCPEKPEEVEDKETGEKYTPVWVK